MKLQRHLKEEVNMKTAIKKAKDRFSSFNKKARDDEHFSKMINLRTKKMKDINKLLAWHSVLENENFHSEATKARDQLRKLGYKGDFYTELDIHRETGY